MHTYILRYNPQDRDIFSYLSIETLLHHSRQAESEHRNIKKSTKSFWMIANWSLIEIADTLEKSLECDGYDICIISLINIWVCERSQLNGNDDKITSWERAHRFPVFNAQENNWWKEISDKEEIVAETETYFVTKASLLLAIRERTYPLNRHPSTYK